MNGNEKCFRRNDKRGGCCAVGVRSAWVWGYRQGCGQDFVLRVGWGSVFFPQKSRTTKFKIDEKITLGFREIDENKFLITSQVKGPFVFVWIRPCRPMRTTLSFKMWIYWCLNEFYEQPQKKIWATSSFCLKLSLNCEWSEF